MSRNASFFALKRSRPAPVQDAVWDALLEVLDQIGKVRTRFDNLSKAWVRGEPPSPELTDCQRHLAQLEALLQAVSDSIQVGEGLPPHVRRARELEWEASR